MRKIKLETFNRAYYSGFGNYEWSSMKNVGFPDQRECVPHIIVGHKERVAHIIHGMDVDCGCSRNNDANVVCFAKMDNGTCYKDNHKPGECKHLIYKERT